MSVLDKIARCLPDWFVRNPPTEEEVEEARRKKMEAQQHYIDSIDELTKVTRTVTRIVRTVNERRGRDNDVNTH